MEVFTWMIGNFQTSKSLNIREREYRCLCSYYVINTYASFKKKLERYLRVNVLGPGPSSYTKTIYRAAVSQRLRNTGLDCSTDWTKHWMLLLWRTASHLAHSTDQASQLFMRNLIKLFGWGRNGSECDLTHWLPVIIIMIVMISIITISFSRWIRSGCYWSVPFRWIAVTPCTDGHLGVPTISDAEGVTPIRRNTLCVILVAYDVQIFFCCGT
jgi:hypothetical protein